MNPETNQFERLPADAKAPEGWIEFAIGEECTVKGYRFKIKRVSAQRLVLEPVGAVCTASNKRENESG